MSAPRTPHRVQMILVPPGCASEDQIVGIAAVPGRLQATPRLPGEPVASLIARALNAVVGHGVLLATFATTSPNPEISA